MMTAVYWDFLTANQGQPGELSLPELEGGSGVKGDSGVLMVCQAILQSRPE